MMQMKQAIILSIGDELVLGQTVDTNSAWISGQLSSAGVKIVGHATVPDDQSLVEKALSDAKDHCDILIISGGIGPTEDDLTRQALAAVMRVPLELDEAALKALTAFYRFLKRDMPESNKIQAMLPRGSTMIENTCGTAAGIRATLKSQTGNSCEVFVMPGVPKEMKAMFSRDIMPWIKQHGGGSAIVSRTLHTFGLGESNIAEILGDLMRRNRNPSVGTTVSGGVVSLRVNSYFSSPDEAQKNADDIVAQCRTKLGELIYGQEEQTLAGCTGELLKQSKMKIATAESCTGGLLAKYLTDIPGSSAYLTHGWVTYANQAKVDQLGVSQMTLEQFGAVSEETAREMAAGAKLKSGADIAIGITGVAGPDGGTSAKPVGMVCIGMAFKEQVVTRTFRFSGDREFVRDRSAKMAMAMVRYHLLGKAMPF